MSPILIITITLSYFALLFVISFLTGSDNSNKAFFVGNKESPWYLVAFGMIGTTLSGITFISVPGWVGASQFGYMQVVLGNFVGYLFIAGVLLPLYYQLKLSSIYTYLQQRLGNVSYKTGALFFLLSRSIGASLRLYLVAVVLQLSVFNQWGIPFAVTVFITLLLIWLYTFRGGIKTIVWTDTLQTTFMLLTVFLAIFFIGKELNLSVGGLVETVRNSPYDQTFFFENGWTESNNFFKQFISGIFIAIVMMGLDQDMMQKNLSCKNTKDAQKNMISFSVVLIFVNLLFLCLGALLYVYANTKGIVVPERSDYLFHTLAFNHMPPLIGVVFLIGLLAAAYSSADSALTALTTSFCVDILGITENDHAEKDSTPITRYLVHIGFSVVLFFIILAFYAYNDEAAIWYIFKLAGFTYGPLLGMFAYGMLTNWQVRDYLVPVVCVLSLLLSFLINTYSAQIFSGYKVGFELLLINGFLTFVGLLLISTGKRDEKVL